MKFTQQLLEDEDINLIL